MQHDEIKQAVLTAIPDSEIELAAEGNHLHIRVVSHTFSGLNAVKRQQLVYASLNRFIESGEVHAVHMKTLTPDEQSA